MTDKEESTATPSEEQSVEISDEDLKGIAGGFAKGVGQVGLGVVAPKPKDPQEPA